jgi:hypothetical protein
MSAKQRGSDDERELEVGFRTRVRRRMNARRTRRKAEHRNRSQT